MVISILTTDKNDVELNKRIKTVETKVASQKKQMSLLKKASRSAPKTLAKSISNVSNKSDQKMDEIKEKYYNEIARDEMYRDKINLNPFAYNKDKYGNLAGNEYDLALDNAFNGFIVAVLQLYTEPNFDFKNPQIALEEKGFKVHRWTKVPQVKEFNDVLNRSCQFWIISDLTSHLSNKYIEIIKKYFNSGKGIYIWGENVPYYQDGNKITKSLFNSEMDGNKWGCQVVKIQEEAKKCGLVTNHLVNTGLDYLYEGHTVATIRENPDLEPIMYGSADNLVIAAYNKDGKRAIIDGGFTRLYMNWDAAGSGRYVKNAAAWLANVENIPI